MHTVQRPPLLSVMVLLLSAGCSGREEATQAPAPASASLEILAFDVVGRPWGDAPVTLTFGWSIRGTDGPLTCQLDWEGDGVIDRTLADCRAETLSTGAGDGATTTYTKTGEHRPRLVVTDGVRTAEASTSIFANFITLAPGVIEPARLPGYVAQEASWPQASDVGRVPPHVVLTFADPSQVPVLVPGTIVWGQTWYMKVAVAVASGATLAIDGEAIPLTAAVQDAFVGARDVAPPMGDARCIAASCEGAVFEPLPASKPHAVRDGALEFEVKKGSAGLKTKLPVGSAQDFEHTLFVGIKVNKVILEIGVFELKRLEVDINPSIKYEFNLLANLFKLDPALSIGPIVLGTIPLSALPPIAVVIALVVDVKAQADFKFGAAIEVNVPLKANYNHQNPNAFTFDVSPELIATPGSKEWSAGLVAKVSVIPKLEILLQGLVGPYLAPVFSVSGEVKGKKGLPPSPSPAVCASDWVADFVSLNGERFCVAYKYELGGEVSIAAPWFEKILKDLKVPKKELTFADITREQCWGFCRPMGADVVSTPDVPLPVDAPLPVDVAVVTDPGVPVIDLGPIDAGGGLGLGADCFEGMTVAIPGTPSYAPSLMTVTNVTEVKGGIAFYPTVIVKPEVGDQSSKVPADAKVFTFGDPALLHGVKGFPEWILGRPVNRSGRSNLIAVWNDPTTGAFEWMFNISAGSYTYTDQAVHRQYQFIYDTRANPRYVYRSFGSGDGVTWKELDPPTPLTAVVSLPKDCFALAQLDVAPASASFGSTAVGQTSAAAAFTVTNVGKAKSSPLAIALGGPNVAVFSVTGGTCGAGGAILDAGASCSIAVTAAPLAGSALGPATASLTVSATLGGTAVATLSTTVTDAGLTLSPSPHDFGVLIGGGSSPDAPFQVGNTGTAPTTAVTLSLDGPDAADFQLTGGTCNSGVTTLAPGATCTAVVRFSPGAAALPGVRTAVLTAIAATGGVATAAVVGTVQVAAALTLLPGKHDVPPTAIGATSSALFTVTNGVGAAPTGPLALAMTGTGASQYAIGGGTCVPGASLPGGASCTVAVTFAPTTKAASAAALTVTAVPGGALAGALTGVGL